MLASLTPCSHWTLRTMGAWFVPCLVLQVEFRDENIYNSKMTVVWVNSDRKKKVCIDAEDFGFKITRESITYESVSSD